MGLYISSYTGSASTINIPTSIDGVRVNTISDGAFKNNTTLTQVSGNSILNIYGGTLSGGGAFQNCRSLTTVDFPNCRCISGDVFYSCSSLTSISFPNCEVLQGAENCAFQDCSSLTSVDLPKCSYIGSAFYNCTSLTSVSLPNCREIGDGMGFAFFNCISLTELSFPNCSYIKDYQAFNYCTSLSKIYLMSTSVCMLYNSTAFTNTGITSSTGSIIVPSSLISAYQLASEWSYFSTQIFGA